MSKVTIYHNPRCSKSRQTLQLLRDHDIEPLLIEYLSSPPSADQLKHILQLLRLSPRQLLRKKEAVYKELNLDDKSLNDTAIIQAMVKHPILIERPIVVTKTRAAIGRPPENVLEII